MFNNFTNKKLTITFGILLLIVAVVIFIDKSGTESTFNQDLVSIDSSKVSKIVLYPKSQNHKEVKLLKQNNKWQVQVSANDFKNIPLGKINELISSALKIVPLRLAAKNESKWKDYQVDTSGTRVEFYEGDEKTLDIVIGKFTFQQPRNMTSYVRLTDDKEVYAVEGFLEFIFNKPTHSFRNENLVTTTSDELKKITLNYKPDSSFTLEKQNDKWIIDGETADSAKAADYIRTISSLSSTEFADGAQLSNQSVGTLNLETMSNKSVTVSILQNNSRYYIKSSQNKDELFYGGKLLPQILKSASDFR